MQDGGPDLFDEESDSAECPHFEINQLSQNLYHPKVILPQSARCARRRPSLSPSGDRRPRGSFRPQSPRITPQVRDHHVECIQYVGQLRGGDPLGDSGFMGTGAGKQFAHDLLALFRQPDRLGAPVRV